MSAPAIPTAAVVPTPAAAPTWRRVVSHGIFEARLILRNGEQLLVTIFLPVIVLVGLSRSSVVELSTSGAARIDVVTPGILALAVMSTAFTSQAIATSFDRRNGVLRLLATTPLGRGGLLAGKFLAVATVEVVQVVVIGGTALALGWRPDPSGILPALVALALGTAAFISLALLVAGTLRAEAVLAGANLLLVLLAVGTGVVVPASQLPGPLATVSRLLPSGALGDGLRGSLLNGGLPVGSAVVLLVWAAVLAWAAGTLFRWD
jgi:ABC-2 type transport system permease protein